MTKNNLYKLVSLFICQSQINESIRLIEKNRHNFERSCESIRSIINILDEKWKKFDELNDKINEILQEHDQLNIVMAKRDSASGNLDYYNDYEKIYLELTGDMLKLLDTKTKAIE